jgi:diguanylate cyclase (GGDEF)-like protein
MEHIRAQRYASQYSLVFIDADNFKHYNDRNGHPAGDRLLKELAQIVRASCRSTDLPARYGGEEFVVLCPETAHPDANVVAERIRKAVQSHPFAHADAQPLGFVSVSVGVACYPVDGQTPEAVLQSADEALYASKQNGRNRVTTAPDLRNSKLKNSA